MTSRFQNTRLRKSTKKGKSAKKKAPEASLDDLLKVASTAMESLDIERAYEAYCQASIQLKNGKVPTDGKNGGVDDLIHVLEKMGELQVSIGDQDLAKEHFVQSLRLLDERKTESPMNISYYETHSSLCFYIGQLSLENEALEAYQSGIRSLEKSMELLEGGQEDVAMEDTTDGADNNQAMLLKQKLSAAYCNIAELYLTDLCEEETAESDCEQYLEKALQLKDTDGEPLVDALQTAASLRLSQQQRQMEAIPFVLRAYEKQRVGSEALATLVGLGDNTVNEENVKGQAQELLEVEAANNLPEFEFRCQTAKLLLECAGLVKGDGSRSDQEKQCISAAISVLGSLLAQNDEVIEIWYLTGCAFAAKQPPMVETAKFHLERAKEMLTDIQKALKDEVQYSDESERQDLEDQLAMNATQMKDVQTKLDQLPEVEDMEED
mmetsp:Transcript_43/g.77  ORF Transcript_43/g.77 Transcript_43/m.77 type:complete len:437 (-) Transcript_43:4170-5480(-)